MIQIIGKIYTDVLIDVYMQLGHFSLLNGGKQLVEGNIDTSAAAGLMGSVRELEDDKKLGTLLFLVRDFGEKICEIDQCRYIS